MFCADLIFALLAEDGGCRRLLYGEDLLSVLDANVSLKFFTALLVPSITSLVDKYIAHQMMFFVRQNYSFIESAQEGGSCEEDCILNFRRLHVEVMNSFW